MSSLGEFLLLNVYGGEKAYLGTGIVQPAGVVFLYKRWEVLVFLLQCFFLGGVQLYSCTRSAVKCCSEQKQIAFLFVCLFVVVVVVNVVLFGGGGGGSSGGGSCTQSAVKCCSEEKKAHTIDSGLLSCYFPTAYFKIFLCMPKDLWPADDATLFQE